MRKSLVSMALLALAPAARAERPITYREALQSALESNPSLQRSALSRDSAEAGLLAASGGFDPTYNLNGYYSKSSSQEVFPGLGVFVFDNEAWGVTNSVSGTTMTGTTLELSQGLSHNAYEVPIFGGTGTTGTGTGTGPTGTELTDVYSGDLRASVTQQLLRGLSFKYNLQNVTLARRSLDVADLSYEKAKQDTLAQAAQAYWTWVYQASVAEIQRESVAVAEEALRVGDLKVAAGELAPVERTRLQAALVQAQANAMDSENAAEQAANALLLAMGESPEQIVLPATPAGEVMDLDLDAARAVEVARQQNLDLLVARANVDTADLERKNANHGRLPTLSATGEVGRVVRDVQTSGEALNYFGDASDPTLLISGNLTAPILNRAARGNARTRSAVVAQRQSELDELERSIGAQVEEQVRQLRSAKRRVELADANQRLAEETLRAEEALSEAGRAIQKDVLEARTEVARTAVEAAKARTDYRLAQVELLRLQGQLTPDLP